MENIRESKEDLTASFKSGDDLIKMREEEEAAHRVVQKQKMTKEEQEAFIDQLFNITNIANYDDLPAQDKVDHYWNTLFSLQSVSKSEHRDILQKTLLKIGLSPDTVRFIEKAYKDQYGQLPYKK